MDLVFRSVKAYNEEVETMCYKTNPTKLYYAYKSKFKTVMNFFSSEI